MSNHEFDASYVKDLEKQLRKNLEVAAIHLQNTIKKKLNRSQPYSISKGKGKWYRGHDPSLPGEPPKKVRGDLQRSISYEMGKKNELSAKVGTNLDYGLYLEFGTRNMEPRPYLRATLIEEAATLDKIICRPPK